MTPNCPISTDDLKPTLKFYDEVLEMNVQAEKYITGFKWCKKINNSQIYYNLGSTLCVFLFDIDNSQSVEEGDNILWVIVGDLPSMYLDTYSIKSLKEPLECYTDLGGQTHHKANVCVDRTESPAYKSIGQRPMQ